MNEEIINNGKEVIDLQIKALRKLKNSLDKPFKDAVKVISKCNHKIIICGVGKSGKIAAKIAATLSSVGTPSFSISANECSHGDLGKISKRDILLLISNSGNTNELNDILKFAKINKIVLIGIVSNKKSKLYKTANIKLLIPELEEAGHGIVPTSSTTAQLALGDALAITLMKVKNFSKLDFKKFHPAGNLGKKLKIASDVMLTGNKIPFVNENLRMQDALKVLNSKKQGFLITINNKKLYTGVFTDGDLKRLIQKKKMINNLEIKKFITKKPYIAEENVLITDILYQLNKRKITNVCIYNKKNKRKITGVLHIHTILTALK